MTRTLILSMFVTIFLVAQSPHICAQLSDSLLFDKGTYSLSGSGLFNRTSFPNSDRTITTLSLATTYLHFTSSYFAFGGQLYYQYINSSSTGFSSEATYFGIGPQFRVYALQRPVPAFLSITLIATSGSTTSFGSTRNALTSSFVSIDLGSDFFVARSLSIEPFLQYQFNFSGGSSSGRNFNIGFSITHFVFHE